MILYADKTTHILHGKVDGHSHGIEQKDTWMGDKEKTFRVVIQYKLKDPIKKEIEKEEIIGKKQDKEGFFIPITKKVKKQIIIREFEPIVEGNDQIELIKEIESGKPLGDYKIDPKTKKISRV